MVKQLLAPRQDTISSKETNTPNPAMALNIKTKIRVILKTLKASLISSNLLANRHKWLQNDPPQTSWQTSATTNQLNPSKPARTRSKPSRLDASPTLNLQTHSQDQWLNHQDPAQLRHDSPTLRGLPCSSLYRPSNKSSPSLSRRCQRPSKPSPNPSPSPSVRDLRDPGLS